MQYGGMTSTGCTASQSKARTGSGHYKGDNKSNDGGKVTGRPLTTSGMKRNQYDDGARQGPDRNKEKELETQQVLGEWKEVSTPILYGGQGKKDGNKRLLRNVDVVCEGQLRGSLGGQWGRHRR